MIFRTKVVIALVIAFILVSKSVFAGEAENFMGPLPINKEFVLKGAKISVLVTEKKIQLVTKEKTIELKGPYFGPKDRWVDATIKTLGRKTYLELKVATFPDGTSEIRSDMWWVVYEISGNRFEQKISHPIATLTHDEFYAAEEYLPRLKTQIKLTAFGRIKFMLNNKELKP